MSKQRQLMYLEFKEDGITGPARIGWVTFSKSGKSIDYNGRRFGKISGFKSNYWDTETHEKYWISGCKIGRNRCPLLDNCRDRPRCARGVLGQYSKPSQAEG